MERCPVFLSHVVLWARHRLDENTVRLLALPRGTCTTPDRPFAPPSRPTSPLFSAPFHRDAPHEVSTPHKTPLTPRNEGPYSVTRGLDCPPVLAVPAEVLSSRPRDPYPPDWLVLWSRGQLARHRPKSVAMASGPVSPGPFPATARP